MELLARRDKRQTMRATIRVALDLRELLLAPTAKGSQYAEEPTDRLLDIGKEVVEVHMRPSFQTLGA